VQSSTAHGSETWHVRKENEMALQWAELRIIRWICGIKVKRKETRIRCYNLGTTAKQVAMV